MEKKRHVSKVKALLSDLHKEEGRRGDHIYLPYHLRRMLEEFKIADSESLVEVIARLVAEHYRRRQDWK